MQPRRVGMAKTANIPPLLATIKNRSTSQKNVKEPDSIFAPPEASSDEDDSPPSSNRTSQLGLRNDPITDSEDDSRRSQHEIRRTQFGDVPPPRVSRNARGRAAGLLSEGGGKGTSMPSGNGKKRLAAGAATEQGDHMKDEYGFVATKRAKVGIRKATSKTYAPGPSRTARKPLEAKLDGPRFKKPPSLTPSPRAPTSASKNFLDFSDEDSALSSSAVKARFQRAGSFSDSSPKKKFKTYADDVLNSPSDNSSKRDKRGRKRRDPAEKDTPTQQEESQGPKFRNPLEGLDLDSQFNVDRAVTNLNMDTNLAGGFIAALESEETQPFEARCPMCHVPVDPSLLKNQSKLGRMSIKQQTAFCRLHKLRAARQLRQEKGYPDIDWGNLERRCLKHQEFLNDVLLGNRRSHFGSMLSDKVRAGKNRTVLKTDEKLVPGYYGPRGLRIMTEFIMRTFSDTVRKRAVEDRLISARGYSGYVQAVLVPELAVRLIMEDMQVLDAEARNILGTSMELGEILYEEAKDVVRREVDNDDDDESDD